MKKAKALLLSLVLIATFLSHTVEAASDPEPPKPGGVQLASDPEPPKPGG